MSEHLELFGPFSESKLGSRKISRDIILLILHPVGEALCFLDTYIS